MEIARVVGGGDLVADVGVIEQDTLLRIADEASSSTALPTLSVGRVTINGSVSSGSGARLRILISGDLSFPFLPARPRSDGIVNLGNATGGIVIPNAGLRDASILAAYVSGDIAGSVDVGRVLRISALGVTHPNGSITGGSILAPITAHAPDLFDIQPGFPPFLLEPAINSITVRRKITGAITALGVDPTPGDTNSGDEQPASIARIVVGPTELADAIITGDIAAPLGSIGILYTLAPIGNPAPAAPVNITAGNGIGQVRAVSPGVTDGFGNAVVFDKDFNVSVVAHKKIVDSRLPGRAAFAFAGIERDGLLSILETGGDLSGPITAANIACAAPPEGQEGGTSSSDFACVKPGISARGVVHGPITVDYAVHVANIIARDFAAPVVVGRFVKGAIAAIGDQAGEGDIPSITIGTGPLPPDSTALDYANRPVGLVGLEGPPPPVLSTPEAWFNAPPLDGGAVDGVIRATGSIGTAEVRALSVQFDIRVLPADACKHFAPRIESPVIGTLSVGDVADGSVWSGHLSGAVGTEFASIGTATIGRLGPPKPDGFGDPPVARNRAALWVRDWTRIDVTHHAFGLIHAPSVPVGSTLAIGGHLGDWFDPLYQTGPFVGTACQGMQWSIPTGFDCVSYNRVCSSRTTEASPRNPAHPECGDLRGRVWVRDPSGLGGQIIINANASVHVPNQQLWTGAVAFGPSTSSAACPTSALTVADDAAQPRQAPHYAASPSTLGGRAIGLVPFTRHAVGDSPAIGQNNPSDPTGPGARAVGAFFASDHSGEVAINFYGPLADARPGDGLPPVVIEWETFPGMEWSDVTAEFDVVLGPGAGGFGHAIRLRPASSAARFNFPLGLFRVLPRVDAATGLSDVLCGGLPTGVVARATWGAAEAYEFIVFSDCDGNGLLSASELRANRTADCGDPVSITPNGVDDVCDIILPPPSGGAVDTNFDGFIDNSCPGTCPADFNRDGTLDPDDLADFIACYFTSPPCARGEVNGDGIVDPDDLADFIAAYFGGCP